MTSGDKKKLYALLRELVILRDKEKCLRCGKQGVLQLSHIYPKGRYRRMEFDPDNVKLLCVGCHLYWWHKNPMEAHDWLQAILPKERLGRLKLMSNTFQGKFDVKLHRLYLEEEIKKLKTSKK